MSFNIVPLEQLGAEGLTLLALHAGSPTSAQVQSKAAAALKVAGVIAAVGTGDATAALTALEGLATTTDPGVQQFISDFGNQANAFLQAQMQLNAAVPLIGAGAQKVATNIAAGITAIATKYVAAPAA